MHIPDQPSSDTPTPDASVPTTQTKGQTGNEAPPPRTDHLDIFLYLRVLLAGWWVILPMALLGGVIGYLIWLHTPPIYRARCQLEIIRNFKLGTEADLITATYRVTFLQRHIILLNSAKLNRQVREKLAPKWESRRPENGMQPHLTIRPLPQSPATMLSISVDSFSWEYSLEYLQELLKAFNDIRYDEAAAVSETTLGYLRKEQANYAQQLQEAEDEIMKFETEHDVMFEEKRSQAHQTLLASLINQENRIATQRSMIEEQFPFLESADPATLQEVLSLALQSAQIGADSAPSTTGKTNPATGGQSSPIVINTSTTMAIPEARDMEKWRENEAEIIRLQAEYDHMKLTFKPTHPKMLDLRDRIDQAKQDLKISAELTLKRLKSRRDALKLQEQALAKAADNLRRSYTPQTATRAQYDRLKVRANRLATLHDSIHDRIVDLTSSAVDKTLSRVVEDPAASQTPIWPIRWKIMFSSVAAGGGLGVVLVFVVFMLKSRLYDFENLERTLNITCVAGVQRLTLTRLKRIRRVPIVVSRERDSTISETFRNLRTSVESSLNPDDRILLLTSPEPSEGKTLLALNAAAVFSWNRNRVLIIDGDFRKLSLRKAIPEAPTVGLTDLLTSTDITLDDCIVKSPLSDVAPNLDYLPAGHKKDDTTELLTLRGIGAIFQQLRERYDLVIIDSAPVNRVVDTILLARQADAVLLVARYGKTTVPAMRYCYSRIGSTNKIIGYVLNGIDKSSGRYNYYSSYGYYYGHSRYYYHSYAYKGYYGDKSTDDTDET